MNTNSKSMAVAAAALAMCMAAGSAFAQDRRFDGRPGPGDHRYEQRDGRFDHRGPPGYRGNQDFRDGRQFDRRGFAAARRMASRGRVPQEYRGRNYVVQDWRAYRLQQRRAATSGWAWAGTSCSRPSPPV